MPTQDKILDVPLHGGMAEGFEDFLFQQPLIDDAKNAIIEKDGSYRRRYGRVTDLDGFVPGDLGNYPVQSIEYHRDHTVSVNTRGVTKHVTTPFGKLGGQRVLDPHPSPALANCECRAAVRRDEYVKYVDYARSPDGYEAIIWVSNTDVALFVDFFSPEGHVIQTIRRDSAGEIYHCQIVWCGDRFVAAFGSGVMWVIESYSRIGDVLQSTDTVTFAAGSVPMNLSTDGSTYVYLSWAFFATSAVVRSYRYLGSDLLASPVVNVSAVAMGVPTALGGAFVDIGLAGTLMLAVAAENEVAICYLDALAWSSTPGFSTTAIWTTPPNTRVEQATLAKMPSGNSVAVAYSYRILTPALPAPPSGDPNIATGGSVVEYMVFNPITEHPPVLQNRGHIYGYRLLSNAVTPPHYNPMFAVCSDPYSGEATLSISPDWWKVATEDYTASNSMWVEVVPQTGENPQVAAPPFSRPVARFLVDGRAFGLPQPSHVSMVGNVLRTVVARITYESPFMTYGGADMVTLDTLPEVTPSVGRAMDLLHFGGGVHSTYDGQFLRDNTPVFPPQVIPVRDTSGFYAAVTVGQRLAFVWEWTDAEGKTHRSAPSYVVTQGTTTGVALDVTFLVAPPYLAVRHNLDYNDQNSFYLEIYASDDTGAEPYRLAARFDAGKMLYYRGLWLRPEKPFGLLNQEKFPALYTTGGVLPAWAPPALWGFCAGRDRLWGISGDDRQEIRYSKLFEEGVAPEFAAELYVRIPANFGKGVAIRAMDEKIIAFCERGIAVVVGDGPNNLGQGGDFAVIPVTSDTGCMSERSIATVPQGLVFQGDRGIYLLDRGLSVQKISHGVQDRLLNSEGRQHVVRDTVLVASQENVRFYLGAAGTLLFYYTKNAWTRFEDTAHNACALPNGDVMTVAWSHFLREYPSASTGSGDGMVLTTGWIKPKGIQGFARVKRAQWLLRCPSNNPGPISIEIGHDYSDAFRQTVSFAANAAAISGRSPRVQIETHIKKQKSESIRFRFTEGWQPGVEYIGNEGPPGVNYVAGLSLLVGLTENDRNFRHLPTKNKR